MAWLVCVSMCVCTFFNPFVLAQRWVIYELFLGDVNTKNHVTPARIFFFIYRTFYCRYYTHALHRIQYFLAVNFNKKDFFLRFLPFFSAYSTTFLEGEKEENFLFYKKRFLYKKEKNKTQRENIWESEKKKR